jgi:hypothetical protein
MLTRIRRAILLALVALGACVPASHALVDEAAQGRCDGGVCPVTCDGGACPVACDRDECRPRVVATLPDWVGLAGLAIAGDRAFLCNSIPKATLQKVYLSDGRRETFGSLDGACPGLDYDPGSQSIIWFINAASTGSQPLVIVSEQVDSLSTSELARPTLPVAVKVRAGQVLWSGRDGSSSGLFVLQDGASLPVPGMTGTTLPGVIAIGAEGRIFVAWPEVKNITMALDPQGTGARLLVDGQRTDRDPLEPLAMAVAGDHLYFGMEGALWRVAVDGKTPAAPVIGAQPRIASLVADDRAVYWIEASGGALYRLTLDGQSLEQLATGLLEARDLAQDAANLYWLEPPRQSLVALRKPP